MGRPPNADAKATWRTIRNAGVKLLSEHGFEAMNLRQLAAASGLKTGSLYNYFASKSQFLSMIMCEIIETILEDFERTVDPVQDPVERLRKFIEFHIGWHTVRRAETFVGFMEMRNLAADDYKKYTSLRRRYEDYVTDIIVRGVEAGRFEVADPRVTTFVLLGMLTATSTWYKRGGRLNQQQLVALHTELVFKMLGVAGQSAPRSMPARARSSKVQSAG